MRGVRVLAAVCCAAACALGATAATAGAAPVVGPAGMAFYTPPSPLPAGTHGDLIWYRSAQVSVPLGPSVNAWNVLYRSTSATGQPIAVTGTVLVPTAAWTGSGPRPVVTYATGTQGLAQKCAPSIEMQPGNSYDELTLIGQALNRGWAVLVTDYEGYINGGAPTYMTGQSMGHVVLDIVNAAAQLPGSGVSLSAPVAIWGYSQGGAGGGWAGQMQPGYDPALKLKGIAIGGVPGDLTAVARNLNANVGAGFLAMAVIGLNNAYPSQLNLDSWLNAAGKAVVANIKTMCQVQVVAQYAYRDIQWYTVGGQTLDQMLALPSWTSVLAANKLGNQKPPVPVFQFHGAADEFIPLAQAKALALTYCSRGVTEYFADGYPGDHVLTNVEATPDAVNWLAGRFAGLPAPNDCSAIPYM